MLMSDLLSGRVRVREGCGRTAEEIIDELWSIFFADEDEIDAHDDLGETDPKPAGHHLRAVAPIT